MKSNPDVKIRISPNAAIKNPPVSMVVMLSLATFVIFFQGFMVAPIIPGLAEIFNVSVQRASFIEPAYLLGYGLATLIYTPLSDKYGRFAIIVFSLAVFIILTAGTYYSTSMTQLILLRLLTGLGAGGVAPTTIGWIADRISYDKRGHALGIFFGCMAGGMAFGSSAGALLTAFLGWKLMFASVAAIGTGILILLLIYTKHFRSAKKHQNGNLPTLLRSFKAIFLLPRGWRTYLFVLFNGMFHSGVFAWTGYLFYHNYQLSERGVGIALLGYGLPGLALGPILGKLADRYGRSKMIPLGIFVGALSAIVLGLNAPLIVTCCCIATLSLGFDLTQPLYAAIITTLSPRKGAATGLFAFFLFMGYGLGSLMFSLLINIGLDETFQLFGAVAVLIAFIAVYVFRNEQ